MRNFVLQPTHKRPECFRLNEMFRVYISKYTKKELLAQKNVPTKVYKDVLKECNTEMMRLIMEENVEFKMPLRLGSLRIRRYKYNPLFKDGSVNPKAQVVDWNKTREWWKELYPGKTIKELKTVFNKPVIYNLNEHTDGWRFRLYWNRRTSNVKHVKVFTAHMTDSWDRYLANLLKTNKNINFYN